MSSPNLQCYHSVQKRSRVPSTKGLESAAIDSSDLSQPRKRSKKNQLYEIEVVEEQQVKVHYCGYSSDYDEWKPKSEVKHITPTFQPAADDHFSPLTELACSIKKKLLPSRHGDLEVRIQVSCDISTFQSLQELGTLSGDARDDECKMKYSIRHYRDLDSVKSGI